MRNTWRRGAVLIGMARSATALRPRGNSLMKKRIEHSRRRGAVLATSLRLCTALWPRARFPIFQVLILRKLCVFRPRSILSNFVDSPGCASPTKLRAVFRCRTTGVSGAIFRGFPGVSGGFRVHTASHRHSKPTSLLAVCRGFLRMC